MSICYYYDIWLRILPKRSGIWRISGANRGIGSHEFCFLTSIGLLHNLAEYIFIFSLSADRQWGFSSFITPLERVQYQTGWDHLWLASRRRYNLDQFNWWKTPDYLDQCFSSQSSSYIHFASGQVPVWGVMGLGQPQSSCLSRGDSMIRIPLTRKFTFKQHHILPMVLRQIRARPIIAVEASILQRFRLPAPLLNHL